MQPDLDVHINTVNQSLWRYVWQQKRGQALFIVPLVIVGEVLAIVALAHFMHDSSQGQALEGQLLGFLLAAPLLVFFSWLGHVTKCFETAFLEGFSLANGYSFNKNGFVDELYGTIFRIDGDQRVSDVVSGTYDSNSLRLFLYELTIQEGRSRIKYPYTILEIDLHGQLPNLLLVSKKMRLKQLDLAGSFGVKNTFTLEGDFNQHFTLYGQPGDSLEALQVFSPDVMELLEDESKSYTVEFTGNRIYMYVNGFVHTNKDITQVFVLAKQLITKIAPLAGRLQNDPALIPAPVNVMQARPGVSFARRMRLIFVFITLLFFLAKIVATIQATPPPASRTTNYQQPVVTQVQMQ